MLDQRKRRATIRILIAAAAMIATMLVPVTAAQAKADNPYKLIYGSMFTHTVFTMDPDGKNHRPFFESFFGETSATPDGRLFVYLSKYDQQLMIRDQSGKINQAIKNIKARMPVISPDGTKIAYVEKAAGKDPFSSSPIRVINLKGKRLATLGIGYLPSFSPDSTQIAFLRQAEVPTEVGCGLDDLTPRRYAVLPGKDAGLRVASANGKGNDWVVKPRTVMQGKPGSKNVQYFKASGIPEWSPDGNSILISGMQTRVFAGSGGVYAQGCVVDDFPLDRTSRVDIYRADIGGDKPDRITAGIKADRKGDLNSPKLGAAIYSLDGTQIFYNSSSRGELWRMAANGAAPKKIFKTPNGGAVETKIGWFLAHPNAQVVTIKATKKCAFEQGTKPGVFTISRTTSSGSQKITLAITKKSTATEGKDYKKFKTTVTIPNGKKKVKVKVKPINDKVRESDETVIVTIKKASGMVIGVPSTATVTIVDNDGGPPSKCR